MHTLPPHTAPSVLRVRDKGQIVGLAIFCKSKTPALRFGRLNQLALHETGNAQLDSIAMEYNGFLAAHGLEDSVARAALEWLARNERSCPVIRLGGIETPLAEIVAEAAAATGREVHVLNETPAPYVDLAAVRASGKDYLEHLSRNSRQALRRSVRYFERQGPLSYQTAQTSAEALQFLSELEQLHQPYWQSRGKAGAFAEPFFKRFHTALINTAFADGHIELARVSANDRPVGYLYNFNWRKTVYAYQSGFVQDKDKMSRPGYVSHYLSVTKACANGENIYDFMAGDRRYKSSLSTAQQPLTWAQIRSPVFVVRLERGLRKIRAALKSGKP